MGPVVDAETGFVYLRARYYDPATGQFLTRDPLEATTASPYGYVGGDPLDVVDPSGRIGARLPSISDLWDGSGGEVVAAASDYIERFPDDFSVGCQMYCDDLSNYASGVTYVSAIACLFTGVTCVVAPVAAAISIGSSGAHFLTTCLDGLDAYCARSFGAFAWTGATMGLGGAATKALVSCGEATVKEAGALSALVVGGNGLITTLMDTQERPDTIERHVR